MLEWSISIHECIIIPIHCSIFLVRKTIPVKTQTIFDQWHIMLHFTCLVMINLSPPPSSNGDLCILSAKKFLLHLFRYSLFLVSNGVKLLCSFPQYFQLFYVVSIGLSNFFKFMKSNSLIVIYKQINNILFFEKNTNLTFIYSFSSFCIQYQLPCCQIFNKIWNQTAWV